MRSGTELVIKSAWAICPVRAFIFCRIVSLCLPLVRHGLRWAVLWQHTAQAGHARLEILSGKTPVVANEYTSAAGMSWLCLSWVFSNSSWSLLRVESVPIRQASSWTVESLFSKSSMCFIVSAPSLCVDEWLSASIDLKKTSSCPS